MTAAVSPRSCSRRTTKRADRGLVYGALGRSAAPLYALGCAVSLSSQSRGHLSASIPAQPETLIRAAPSNRDGGAYSRTGLAQDDRSSIHGIAHPHPGAAAGSAQEGRGGARRAQGAP